MTSGSIAIATSFLALIGMVITAWFAHKSSTKATERTAEVQEQANQTDRFDKLTAAQERELARAYARLEHAEQVATVAGQRAEEAVERAEEALRTAEQLGLRLTQLTVTARELHKWASQPCPHPMPPPPLPTWFPFHD